MTSPTTSPTTTATPTVAAETATIAGLASALRPALLRLSRRLRRMRDPRVEIGPNQASALGALLRGGPLAIGVLAEREGMQPPSMTKVVKGLEALGLVRREPDPGDRRLAVVSITEAGRDHVLAERRRRDAWLAVRIGELDREDREVLRRAVVILEKVNHP